MVERAVLGKWENDIWDLTVIDKILWSARELPCHAMVCYKYKSAFHRKSIMQRYSHSANFLHKLASVLPAVQTLLDSQTCHCPLMSPFVRLVAYNMQGRKLNSTQVSVGSATLRRRGQLRKQGVVSSGNQMISFGYHTSPLGKGYL